MSSYHTKRKGRIRDTYGEWSNGRQLKPDIICGTTIWNPDDDPRRNRP